MLCDTTNGARAPITEKATPPDCADRHVLLVDDELNVLKTVGAFLAKAGFAVCKTSSGDEALRMMVADSAIEVLVTDLAMPGMSGAELISQATQIRPTLRALMMTGYPSADGLTDLPPNTSILVKPFRRTELIAGVKSLLGEIRAAQN
jgi:DNA-binding NtrC family response regulator